MSKDQDDVQDDTKVRTEYMYRAARVRRWLGYFEADCFIVKRL